MSEENMTRLSPEIGGLTYGPDGFTKIAILGTSSSSVGLSPWKDPSWSIWACSPGCYPICAQNRSDVWFEPHRWQPYQPGEPGAPGTKPWFSPEFHAFLRKHKGPVFMSAVDPTIPMSVRIPFEYLVETYGPYFWTSTISYMIAMAIEQLRPRAQAGEKVAIGMFGVDMAATEEYAYQRPGCQHFLGLAMSLGIQVVLPPESDLMRPPTMYGIGELNHRHIRFLARKKEAEANIGQLNAQIAQLTHAKVRLEGMLAEQDYMLNTWSDDITPDLKNAVSFSQEYLSPLGRLNSAVNDVTANDIKTTGAEVVPLDKKA